MSLFVPDPGRADAGPADCHGIRGRTSEQVRHMDPSTSTPQPAGHRRRRSPGFRLAVFVIVLGTVAAALAALVLPADAGKRFTLPWSADSPSSGSSAPGVAPAAAAVPLPS